MKATVAVFFGGPDDGATKVLFASDLESGYVDTMDSLGNTIRHTVVKLDSPREVGDIVVGYELRPTEGVW